MEMSMNALIVVDAQNEFSPEGKRPVPDHGEALSQILAQVESARKQNWPIAWVRHYNKPKESKALIPGEWGSELSAGCCPDSSLENEQLFEKDVYGAFTKTELETWLRARGVDTVLIAGFYPHMCLSTSVREALVRGFTFWSTHVRLEHATWFMPRWEGNLQMRSAVPRFFSLPRWVPLSSMRADGSVEAQRRTRVTSDLVPHHWRIYPISL
jgi:isochorismate hydrolase